MTTRLRLRRLSGGHNEMAVAGVRVTIRALVAAENDTSCHRGHHSGGVRRRAEPPERSEGSSRWLLVARQRPMLHCPSRREPGGTGGTSHAQPAARSLPTSRLEAEGRPHDKRRVGLRFRACPEAMRATARICFRGRYSSAPTVEDASLDSERRVPRSAASPIAAHAREPAARPEGHRAVGT